MNRWFPPVRVLSALCLAPMLAFGADPDPFQELVRPTEALPPEAERAAFHVPPGFEVQLVASEPDLRKPMNMQWDVLGRLWITESREYPFPVKDGSTPRDTVRIFSDFAPDGHARKVEIFADGLNIPTGLYPFRSANAEGRLTWKCVVWSIPNIWLMEDTDGDGRADKREVLYGPLGWERDTHGNLSSFRRGQDGWLYGTHGFNNQSTMRGKDGSELTIQSGNTYRIRLDGERVEGHTFGQVNPFGLAWDPRGDLYSADCHSSPIYQLLRGASYPSFGKPHDGLGFGPQTVLHSHGSTAICAPIYVSDPAWPAEWQDHMFVGNVQTSRLNHDKIVWHGSSTKGEEKPDFLSTDDPWFRPVDVSWGPDGALYVADFYNRIIGHYEVPLTHPGRDRERGRLWRIVYRGTPAPVAPVSLPTAALPPPVLPLPALPLEIPALVQELGSGNATRRTLALQELCDVAGARAVPELQKALSQGQSALQKVNSLWALHRLGALGSDAVVAAIRDNDALVRTHALRLARERCYFSPPVAGGVKSGRLPDAEKRRSEGAPLVAAAKSALQDGDALVVRCAVEVLGSQPSAENIQPLLEAWGRAAGDDDHLIHVIRMALRDQLSDKAAAEAIAKQEPPAGKSLERLLDVMAAVPGEEAATIRFAWLGKVEMPVGLLVSQGPSLAKSLPMEDVERLGTLLRERLAGNVDGQGNALLAIATALQGRNVAPTPAMKEWGNGLAKELLKETADPGAWSTVAPEGVLSTNASPWTTQERTCADGQKIRVLSSFPLGEALTGVLRSKSFALPAKLSFYLCGHDGDPHGPAMKKNRVRLREAATGDTLREAAPPRNDIAQRVEWKLDDLQGREGYLELTDGDSGAAYAWLALGRFEPALPQLAVADPASANRRQIAGADLARMLHLDEQAGTMRQLLGQAGVDAEVRLAAARALLTLDEKAMEPIGSLLADSATTLVLREKLAKALGEVKSRPAERVLVAALGGAPHRLQGVLAEALAGTREGAEGLVTACSEGKASAGLLREKALASRLKALNNDDLNRKIDTLTAKLPPANEELNKLIAARVAAFQPKRPGAMDHGGELFARNCAACHTISGKGGNVGPQLDGIGGRGPERLMEDILDPSRNVDRAFRIIAVTKKDGSVVSGLFRREEGSELVLADLAAQEIHIPKEQVATRQETEASLMPPIFGETMTADELSDLVVFLQGKAAVK